MVRRASICAVICALLSPLCGRVEAAPIGYSVRAHASDYLYAIDLSTGVATNIGRLEFGDAEGLAIIDDTLFTIGGGEETFWNITVPPGSFIGDTGVRLGGDAGLAETRSGVLYNLQGDLNGTSHLYRIDSATGAASFIGS